ncbi:hypothetical protein [Pontibacillus yanchengensis]|uniref:Uncharacterized protein n=1 Tax=Pontibacillus yanchengensis Y32 TaxID=1385514 RepID=A0A0A2TEY1_9BACI|nr:hypothetical protein [Pontibacillus yanchengensis]KGP74129.1 hypothetical protein N782_17525 [Pontibacillus yanchengensis Y32]
MSTTTISVKDQKHTYTFNLERMTIYKQSKIIEARDAEAQLFYLFFYKDSYINTVKAKELKPNSHAANAFEHGVTFQAPHPLIDATLAASGPYKKHRFNDLFPKLQKQHTLQETTLIATFFESFIKKEQLMKFIKTLYNEDRRSGKMYACYRIYRVAQAFAPTHSWVKSLAGELDFKKYAPLYEKLDASLFEKDPIYVEQFLYENRDTPERFNQLSTFLQQQGRWIDDIALSIDRFNKQQTNELYEAIHEKIKVHFESDELIRLLEDLYERAPNLEPLQQDILDTYLKQDQPERALKLIATHHIELHPSQVKTFDHIVDHIDLESSSVSIEELNTVIGSLFTSIPKQAETLLQKALRMLMKEHSISYIQQWLNPLRDVPEAQQTIAKVDQIQELEDDPNKQLQLGELYYEFNQLNQAIECFSWEMELNEQNPKPVQWLSKLYNELGMNHEAKAYQQLYVDMVKNG